MAETRNRRAFQIGKTVSEKGDSVTFSFVTGKGNAKTSIAESFAVKVKDFPAEIRNRLLCHGISQKIGDAAAPLPSTASVEEVRNAVIAMRDRLMAGDWKGERSGGLQRVDLWAEAFRNVAITQGKDETTLPATEVLVKALTANSAKLATLRANSVVRAEFDRLKAAESAAKAGTDANANVADLFDDIG